MVTKQLGKSARRAVLTMVTMAAAVLGSATCLAQQTRYSVIVGGKQIGALTTETQGSNVTVDYVSSDSGRTMSMAEKLQLDARGLPMEWSITGKTSFGSTIAEHFAVAGSHAEWSDSTGNGESNLSGPALYIPQTRSPWSDSLFVRALLKAPDHALPTLPGGSVKLSKGETISVSGASGSLQVIHYDLSGFSLNPSSVIVDEKGALFAAFDNVAVIVRAGYEGEVDRLKTMAADWKHDRLVQMERRVAHRYTTPVRIRNVRVFDPVSMALTQPVSVVVNGTTISAVEPLEMAPTAGETTIEGGGGTLIAGMYDVYVHIKPEQALLKVADGVTSVRDGGNFNNELDQLDQQVDSGLIGGPHIIRAGMIEGDNPYAEHRGGVIVPDQAKALEWVRWYGARNYFEITIFNGIHADWVPAMAAEAHRLGMRVEGRFPAFATTNQMIEAGYDEVTHINTLGFDWMMQPGDDTRTLFRVTGLKRFGSLDLSTVKVRDTIDLMVKKKIVLNPTLGIHELFTLGRDGQVPPGDVDYFDHMPVLWRRTALKGSFDMSAPGDDQAYRAAFPKIMDMARLLNNRGIFMLFGTDIIGPFTYHRELELYQQIGMTAAQVLKRATLDSAKYFHQDQKLGSIEKGKLADFFLVPGNPLSDLKAVKTISMVVKDGTFYFPSEIYPEFSIKPFAAAPVVTPPTLH